MVSSQRLPTRPRCDPIDFEAVAARQSTIKDAWRDYLRHAARPYSFDTFYRHFFRWREMQREALLRTASGLDVLNPTADEFVASEQYWRNRSAPKTKIIALRNNASVRVQNGALELTERLPLHLAPDGEPHVVRFNVDEARRGRISQLAPSMPRAIILPEHGWHLTAEAVKFCILTTSRWPALPRARRKEKRVSSRSSQATQSPTPSYCGLRFGQTRRT